MDDKELKGMLEDRIKEIKGHLTEVSDGIRKADAARVEAFEDMKKARETDKAEIEKRLEKITGEMAEKLASMEEMQDQIDAMQKMLDRPDMTGAGAEGLDAEMRKDAIELYRARFAKAADGVAEALSFDPDKHVDYEEYKAFRSAIHKQFHAPSSDALKAMLTQAEFKALSTFAAGGNSWLLMPQISNTILSCLKEETDVLSLMAQMNISKGSVKLPEDNSWDEAAWACEKDCFANNPTAKLLEGLGEREIVANSLRYTVCTTREFLEDAEIDVITWISAKVKDAFTRAISKGIMVGSGKGMPMGILNAKSGIGSVTAKAEGDGGAPAGGFTWQDLYALKYAIPAEYHGPGFAFMTGQDGMGYILTMTGADGHPIWRPTPQPGGGVLADGSVIRVNTWMPAMNASAGWATGAAPVAAGNWKRAYQVVSRKNVTMQRDDYSAGYCVLFKFEARIGGDVLCANAARLLKVL